jgi:hypothetical protein
VVPLQDFAKAYDGPPTDPKKFEEQQKQLQDELQKRAEEARKKLEGQQQPAPPAAPTRSQPKFRFRRHRRAPRARLFAILDPRKQ